MALQWTYHPILEIPSQEEQLAMGPERLLEYYERREAAIEREIEDPFNFSTELPHWKLADDALKKYGEVIILGGNRSGKTTAIAKRVVQCVVHNPGTTVWCFASNSQCSIQVQQAAIYKFLPNEFKTIGHTRVASVRYSVKNGFTNQTFVLPNRSQVVFKNWSQDISSIEGGEIGCPNDAVEGTFNIAAWFDEEVPLSYWSTTAYRTLTRADSDGTPARMIATFTTISGWTPMVSRYLSGARTVEDREAELLEGEKVPLIQQPLRTNSRIVYFHTSENPYGGWESMKNQLQGAKRDEILCRAYGVPTKPSNTVFQNLDDRVVMKHSEIPVIKDPVNHPANWVLSIDPAGNKSWFMVLVAVAANGVHYVVKEWPDPSFGPWADLERGEKGRPGEAAAPNGYGIQDYAEVIREMIGSKDCEILIDPRLGSASYSKAEGTSNIIADLHDEGIQAYPADGLPIDDGLQAINNLLSYDKTKEIGFDNHSRLIFSDECGNTIYCCMNYKVEDGPKGVCKDPVDCLRYVAVGNFEYYDESELMPTQSGGY
jgi:hypothetical protein